MEAGPMAEHTKIEWADHTFNPWTGCTRVSPACQHCYAETWAKRSGLVEWGPHADRRVTSPAVWRQPLKWNAAAAAAGTRPRVFCASLADVFDDHRSISARARADLWQLIADTPNLDWLLLTKRPENWPSLLPAAEPRRPFDHVRLGVTIEDQARFDQRGPLLQMAADIGWPTFVSYEPALGPVDWRTAFEGKAIGWFICGGESGHGARPMDPAWAQVPLRLCQVHDVPFFFKQWGSCLPCSWDGEDERGRWGNAWIIDEDHSSIDYDDLGRGQRVEAYGREFVRFPHKNTGRLLDGHTWDEFPKVRR
jgi:protein gp37